MVLSLRSTVALLIVENLSITGTVAGKLLNCDVMSGTSHAPGFEKFELKNVLKSRPNLINVLGACLGAWLCQVNGIAHLNQQP